MRCANFVRTALLPTGETPGVRNRRALTASTAEADRRDFSAFRKPQLRLAASRTLGIARMHQTTNTARLLAKTAQQSRA